VSDEDLYVRTAIAAWKTTIARIDKMFARFTDDELQTEVAPQRNRVIYILGHLTAFHDRMFPLLGLGERLYPELDEVFISSPDRKHSEHSDPPSGAALRSAWNEVNITLQERFDSLSASEWLERHTQISIEDFDKDPLRNRLAVLINRTNHASYHAGQVRLIW
jgi:hypothetical protein